MLTLQFAVGAIFIQRHFEDVTRQMTNNIVREIEFVLAQLETQSIQTVAQTDAAILDLRLTPWDGQKQNPNMVWYDISGKTVIPTLTQAVSSVREADLSDLKIVIVRLDSAAGPGSVQFSRSRVSASNPHQLLVLMGVIGFFMTILAFIFLRNQIRPIKKLAQAAHAFGRGQKIPLRSRGAIEVRAATQAFLDMRDRIERQIEQRTMMLSGVSHDLRTPLTRMQLALEMVQDADELGLKQDIVDMTAMLDAYLAYARDAAEENYETIDVAEKIKEICARFGPDVECEITGQKRDIPLRPVLALRAIKNLIGNALKYGTQAKVTINFQSRHVVIRIDDDGPGIPADQRDAALRPFVRLDPARNQNQTGVGLGLAIANDAIKLHGGSLMLGDSKMLSGLGVSLTLPYARHEPQGIW